jgi:hypothetical protein
VQETIDPVCSAKREIIGKDVYPSPAAEALKREQQFLRVEICLNLKSGRNIVLHV